MALISCSERWLLLAIAAMIAAGCDRAPQAPELRDSPVYKNRTEGFRFLVPDGWIQTASSVLPKGKLEGEPALVRYRMNTPEQGAMLIVIATEYDPNEDLFEYHQGPSFRVEKWNVLLPPEKIEVNGKPAERMVFKAPVSGREMTKEVVLFQNNSRIYHFVGMFWSTDEKAQQQIRRAIESTLWD